MKRVFSILAAVVLTASLSAQTIYPTPHRVIKGDGTVRYDAKKIRTRTDKSIASEGYVLDISKKGITITSADERGAFYAQKTLAQIVKDGKVPVVRVEDYPEIRFRGVVEGFYGNPWSHRDRLSQFEFYGKNKLNTYIYGPKDDPYHSAPNWRKPYPVNEAAQITELTKAAKANQVDFVWAIHPGGDIKWNEEDFENLLRKFNDMYDLGVRSFAVFFDDIGGDGTNPNRQAELLNRLNREFVKVKGDVTPLIMCPTEYNKSWANQSLTEGYLPTLGRELDKDVEVMWTGDRVCADITTETLEWINARIGRPTYIWWNFPVSDYVRHMLLQGPSYGLTKDAKGRMSGFASNPMEHAEASKIALFGVADYTWNPTVYDPIKAWEASFEHIMPQAAAAYRNFAIHSSDLEKNGHGYRRDESWETNVNSNQDLAKAFADLRTASTVIPASGADEYLVGELKPWLVQAGVVGQMGQKTIKLNAIDLKADPRASWIGWIDSELSPEQVAQFNKNKVGTLKLMPWINATRDSVARALYTVLGGVASSNTNAKAKIFSTVARVSEQTVVDVANVVSVAPILEQFEVAPGAYFGVELPAVMTIEKIEASIPGGGRLKRQFSNDGGEWSEKAAQARYVRYVNSEDKPQSVRLSSFTINVMPSADNIAALTDGDLRSAYELNGELTIAVPQSATGITVLGENGSQADIEGQCNALSLVYVAQDIPQGTEKITLRNAKGKVREIIWTFTK